MKYIAIALIAVAVSFPAVAVDSDGTRPDPALTPGAVRTTDADVICNSGSTKLIRNVPGSTKQAVFARYGLTNKRDKWCSSDEGCEVDHLVSLELGGSNSIENLWPQPYEGALNAHDKDALENKLHKMVCAGRVTPQDAQEAIRTDWVAAFHKYVTNR